MKKKLIIKNTLIALGNIIVHLLNISISSHRKGYHYYQIGCSFFYLNNYHISCRYLSKAHASGFSNDDLFYRRGVCYEKKGKPDFAVTDYSEAIKLNPNESVIYYNRGNAYSDIGNYQSAIKDYCKNIELNKNDPKPYFGLGFVYLLQNDIKKSIYNYKQGMNIEPRYKKYLPPLIRKKIENEKE